jgi:hypothetical protein
MKFGNKGRRTVAIGSLAFSGAGVGADSVYVGYSSGRSNTGSGNVFLGYGTGWTTLTGNSNTLIIANSDTATPLIYGLFTGAGAGLIVYSQNAAGIPLVVRGIAAQTSSLFQLQDSTSAVVVDSGDGLAGSAFVFNEGGIDIDFRVESATYNAILVDADQDELELMSNAAGKIGFFGVIPVVQQAHIVDADGTLADVTAKFNTLLSELETLGLLAAA